MADGPAGRSRIDGFARRLARRRQKPVEPVPGEVHDELLKDLAMEGGEAAGVKGGTTQYGTQCGYRGYYCPPGYYKCINGICYP